MKAFTPLKSSFISFEITPPKQLVNYEINSWMQTNDKRRAPSAFIKPQKNHIPLQPANRTSLASLRQKRLDLLKNSVKKYHRKVVPISLLNTKCEPKTAASANSESPLSLHSLTPNLATSLNVHSKSLTNNNAKAPIIQVSQFQVDNKELAELKTRKTLRTVFRPQSGKNLGRISGQIKSNMILQAKVTENHYKRMSFVSKKLIKQN